MADLNNMPGTWAWDPWEPSVPTHQPATALTNQPNFAGGSPSDYNNFGDPPTELPADIPSQLEGRNAIPEIRNDDTGTGSTINKRPIIIAVFGQTGTGKTSFVKAVTGQDLKVGHSLTSCTENVLAVPLKIGNKDVLLIDTPGFSDTHLSDTEVLRRIANWMRESYDEGSLLSGIIYLHRIIDPRFDGPSLKNLRMMKKLCGSESLKNVVLATTMWEQVAIDQGIRREEELKSTFWKDMIAGGATVSKIGNESSTDAVAIIRAMLNNTPVVTTLQQELSVGMELRDTDAGSEIRQDFAKLETKLRQEMEEARQDLDIATKNKNHQEQQALKAEIEQVRQSMRRLEVEKDLLERSTPKPLPKVNREGLFGILGYHCKSCRKHTNKSGKWTCPSCDYMQINRW